jgi:hypothetical protein
MTIFADALNNVRSMGSKDPRDEFLQKITKTARGSFIGLIGGLMAGWYYKKNLYVYGLLGTIVGGGINLLFNENSEG